MSIQYNFLKAHLIAREFGLSESGLSWPDWIDTLDEDSVEKLQGCLIKKFGRKVVEDPPNQANFYVYSYLSRLESKFSDWLNSSREMIDYTIASHCIKSDIEEENWYWSEMHQKIWSFRGYTERSIEVQMMPMIEISLCEMLSKHLDPKIKMILSNAVENFDSAEDIINYFEASCNYLGQKVVFDDLLQPLRKLRTKPAVIDDNMGIVDLLNKFRLLLPSDDYIKLSKTIDELQRKVENKEKLSESDSYNIKTYLNRINDSYNYFGSSSFVTYAKPTR